VNAIFDTNIVIYLQMGLLARPLPRGEYLLSVISELELRSFHGLDAASQSWLNAFLSDISIVELDERVKQNTVRLRRVLCIACVCPMPSSPLAPWPTRPPC
jgi:predicted nucleic acid-binding protein